MSWFGGSNTRKVGEVGTSLADQFLASATEPPKRRKKGAGPDAQLDKLLAQVDRDVVPLKLGVFGRAKLANSFKWRLLDQGIDSEVVDELTRLLLVRISEKGRQKVSTP